MASVTAAELINMMVGRDLDDLFPKLDITPGEEQSAGNSGPVPNKFADI
ncbi:MAG: hypothetical protein M9928_17795 [Anaerolineae bacterium]|nr:hypothetical protein [Anaerolineae bacterium]